MLVTGGIDATKARLALVPPFHVPGRSAGSPAVQSQNKKVSS